MKSISVMLLFFWLMGIIRIPTEDAQGEPNYRDYHSGVDYTTREHDQEENKNNDETQRHLHLWHIIMVKNEKPLTLCCDVGSAQ